MTTEQIDRPDAAAPAIRAFSLAIEPAKRAVGLKLDLGDGRQEMLILALPVLRHIRTVLMGTLRTRREMDTLPTDEGFFRRMPQAAAADWNLATPTTAVAAGCEITTHPDLCTLAFPLRGEGAGARRYHLRPLHAAYLLHAINDALENEDLRAMEESAASA